MGGQTATSCFVLVDTYSTLTLLAFLEVASRPCAACNFCVLQNTNQIRNMQLCETPKYAQHLTRLSLSSYTQISASAKIQFVRSSSALSKPNRFCCCDIIMQEQTNITRCCNRRATHEPEGIDSCCRIHGPRCMCL